MTRFLPLLLVWLATLLLGAPALAQSNEPLLVVRVEGPLDIGSLALVHRAVETARERGGRLVVDLDTPGGAVDLMWRIVAELDDALSSGVPTVAWIHDHAHSAGALVALACERVYATSLGSIGSALPVSIGVGGLVPVSQDEEVKEKLSSALRAEFRGIAEERGRPGVVAEAMVDPGVVVRQVRVDGEVRLVNAKTWDDLRDRGENVELLRTVSSDGELLNVTAREGIELGLIDGVANDLAELAAKLGAERAEVVPIERSRSEGLAGLLYRIGPLLFVLGFLLAWIEFKVPGFGVPGILSVIAFGVALFGRYLVGLADVPHLVLFVLGVVGIAAELFLVPGTLWAGIGGAIALVVAGVWSLAGNGVGLEYPLEQQLLVDDLFLLVVLALAGLAGSWLLSRVLPKTSVFARFAVAPTAATGGVAAALPQAVQERTVTVGARGRALTALRPVGKVHIDRHGRHEFEALAPGGALLPGTRVEVLEIQRSGRLVVAAANDDTEERA